MSSIHYKFKSAKDYDTYRFEGAGIPVWDLKNEIIRAKKLEKSQDFDLVISNAQTNEGINLIQVTAGLISIIFGINLLFILHPCFYVLGIKLFVL